MFLSSFEKQLDAKRRIVVPVEFRALVAGPFDGVVCFPSIEADCLEGGGKALFDHYKALIEELPFGDPLRSALETTVYGGMAQLGFDTAGRITLPETLCEQFGIDRLGDGRGSRRPVPDLVARRLPRASGPAAAGRPRGAGRSMRQAQRLARTGAAA